jgi:hypothetical protein
MFLELDSGSDKSLVGVLECNKLAKVQLVRVSECRKDALKLAM